MKIKYEIFKEILERRDIIYKGIIIRLIIYFLLVIIDSRDNRIIFWKYNREINLKLELFILM